MSDNSNCATFDGEILTSVSEAFAEPDSHKKRGSPANQVRKDPRKGLAGLMRSEPVYEGCVCSCSERRAIWLPQYQVERKVKQKESQLHYTNHAKPRNEFKRRPFRRVPRSHFRKVFDGSRQDFGLQLLRFCAAFPSR